MQVYRLEMFNFAQEVGKTHREGKHLRAVPMLSGAGGELLFLEIPIIWLRFLSSFSPPKCEMIGGYLPASSKNSIFAVEVKRSNGETPCRAAA